MRRSAIRGPLLRAETPGRHGDYPGRDEQANDRLAPSEKKNPMLSGRLRPFSSLRVGIDSAYVVGVNG